VCSFFVLVLVLVIVLVIVIVLVLVRAENSISVFHPASIFP